MKENDFPRLADIPAVSEKTVRNYRLDAMKKNILQNMQDIWISYCTIEKDPVQIRATHVKLMDIFNSIDKTIE